MAITPFPIGKMSLDKGPGPGDHLWVVADVIRNIGGFDKMGEWAATSGSIAHGGTNHVVSNAFCWRGAGVGRVYAATNSKFFEVSDSLTTDVTGTTTPTNSTNGATFAGYGEWCFAANGVDKIQTIKVPAALGSSNNFEDMVYTTGGAKISPKYICSHKNHIVAADLTFIESYAEIATATTGVGGQFANQPVSDGVEIISTDGGDVWTFIIFGTRAGQGDTLYAASGTLLGTAQQTTTYTDWNKILGITLSGAALGTITVRRAADNAKIVDFLPGDASKGVYNVPTADQAGGDRVIDIVASAATTKQVGIVGTTPGGALYYDSQALNGITTVQSNSEFRSIQNILIGDIENTITVTTTSHVYPAGYNDPYLVWWSGTDDPEGYGTEVYAPQIIGSSNQPLLDGSGKITGVADGGDCFFVFKSGSIYRFDGPPFQPTIISHTKGMQPGNYPYRQGDRVYFWCVDGLSYIDIRNNNVETLGVDTNQRSFMDYAYPNAGSNVGSYPVSMTSTVTPSIACVANSKVSISGDPSLSLVMLMYSSSFDTTKARGVVYHERTDEFTIITGPPVTSSALGCVLVHQEDDSGTLNGTFYKLRCFGRKSNSVIDYYKINAAGYSPTSTNEAYIRYPFINTTGKNTRARILRVRPWFDDDMEGATTYTHAIKIEVLSISGTNKRWATDSVFSVGSGTTSKDGWITVDGCPYADKHSIGISILGSASGTGAYRGMVGFTGIEVDYLEGPSRSI